jgi:hypothetical protein
MTRLEVLPEQHGRLQESRRGRPCRVDLEELLARDLARGAFVERDAAESHARAGEQQRRDRRARPRRHLQADRREHAPQHRDALGDPSAAQELLRGGALELDRLLGRRSAGRDRVRLGRERTATVTSATCTA